ncbi:MAG: hypothetical protein IPP93_16175 [Chitinophagaceae bacterium]|nr:hypothetical protein [Chitinophagaceae bacterium]
MTTGSTPTVAGTCWSATERNLTLENSSGHTINRPGADGQYTDTLKGLIYNKKHYIRAYATNNA